MGATPVPATEIGRFAREFEEGGWDGLAVGEAHGLLPDPYATLAVAAAATTTLKVGTAVAVPLRASAARGGCDGDAPGPLERPGALLSRTRRRRHEGAPAEADAGRRVRAVSARLQGFLGRENVDLDDVPCLDGATRRHRPVACRSSGRASTSPRPGRRRSRPRPVWPTGSASRSAPTSGGCERRSGRARAICEAAGKDPGDAGPRLLRPGGRDRRCRRRARGRRSAGWSSPTRASRASRRSRQGTSPTQSHDRYRNAVTVMEDVYHAERGGVTRTEGGEPGEIDFYPREAGADDLIDQFAIAGPPEYCAARLREIMALGVRADLHRDARRRRRSRRAERRADRPRGACPSCR